MMTSGTMQNEPLALRSESVGGVTTVYCTGRFTSDTASRLPGYVKPLIPQSTAIVLDLSGVTYMDSMGLGTVASLYVSTRGRQAEFHVVNLTPHVRQLFTMTRLLSLFEAAGESDVRIV